MLIIFYFFCFYFDFLRFIFWIDIRRLNIIININQATIIQEIDSYINQRLSILAFTLPSKRNTIICIFFVFNRSGFPKCSNIHLVVQYIANITAPVIKINSCIYIRIECPEFTEIFIPPIKYLKTLFFGTNWINFYKHFHPRWLQLVARWGKWHDCYNLSAIKTNNWSLYRIWLINKFYF